MEPNLLEMNDADGAEALCRRGLDLLAAGRPAEAAQAFRAAVARSPIEAGAQSETHVEAHHGLVRALRDAGQLEQSVAAALALTALSISLQAAGHVPEAEAAAARARVLEWKIQLQSPPGGDFPK
jgi:tetratricopeptide (TPR) repeat protein